MGACETNKVFAPIECTSIYEWMALESLRYLESYTHYAIVKSGVKSHEA